MSGDRYVRLMRSIWNDDDFRALSHLEQWLYIALLSQPDTSAAGIVPLIERRWVGLAAGLDRAIVGDALEALEAAGFVLVDDDTGEVLIRSYIRHDGLLRSPNGRKAVDRAVGAVLSAPLREVCRRAVAEHTPDNGENPRSEGPTEGATEGAPPGATEGDAALHSQQPAARTNSKSQQPAAASPPPDPAFVDAVVESLIGHRLRTERNIRSPQRYRAKLASSLPLEHADRIAELHSRWPTASASLIAGVIETGDTRPLANHQEQT